MTIQFVLDSLVMTGGFRVVAEHAQRLRRRGHQVRLLVPHSRLPGAGSSLVAWKRWAYETFAPGVSDGLNLYGLRGAVCRFDPEQPARVPPADVVIATAWRTAEWVASMPPSAGRGHYLIQAYEAWADVDASRVDATWRLPLRRIVVAGWLQEMARERFGVDAFRIPNGVDSALFAPPDRRPSVPLHVGMLYDLSAWKGADEGIEVLHRIHAAMPDVRFMVFGRYRVRHKFPPGTTYARDPRQRELPRLYGAMHVFLNTSHSEGFSLVTLEAMSCGCALVATDVGEVPVMGRPGHDYLMVPRGDVAQATQAVLELLHDQNRLSQVARNGQALAAQYDWERATDSLERALSGDGTR